MTKEQLATLLERVEAWPEEAQEELVQVARDIEAGLEGGTYHASPAELEGIDRGIRAADEGRFASEEEVEAVFRKLRQA